MSRLNHIPECEEDLKDENPTPYVNLYHEFDRISKEFLTSQLSLYNSITDSMRYVCSDSGIQCSCGALPQSNWSSLCIDYLPFLNKNTLYHLMIDHVYNLTRGTTYEYLKSYGYLISITDFIGDIQTCEFCNKIASINCDLRDLSMLVKTYINLTWEIIRTIMTNNLAHISEIDSNHVVQLNMNSIQDFIVHILSKYYTDYILIVAHGIHANARVDFIVQQFPSFMINHRRLFDTFISAQKKFAIENPI